MSINYRRKQKYTCLNYKYERLIVVLLVFYSATTVKRNVAVMAKMVSA